MILDTEGQILHPSLYSISTVVITHRSREYNTACQDLGLGSKYGVDFSIGIAGHI